MNGTFPSLVILLAAENPVPVMVNMTVKRPASAKQTGQHVEWKAR